MGLECDQGRVWLEPRELGWCWEGRLERPAGIYPYAHRYMSVVTSAPRVIILSYTQLHTCMIKDTEMLIKNLISVCVCTVTHTCTHTPTLCKMSCPLNHLFTVSPLSFS